MRGAGSGTQRGASQELPDSRQTPMLKHADPCQSRSSEWVLMFGKQGQFSPCFPSSGPLHGSAETWPSGRRRSPAKGVGGKPSRGFESLRLRHLTSFSISSGCLGCVCSQGNQGCATGLVFRSSSTLFVLSHCVGQNDLHPSWSMSLASWRRRRSWRLWPRQAFRRHSQMSASSPRELDWDQAVG